MASPSFRPQTLDYFLVLDFEATCDNEAQPDPQEIIEFPCLKVSAKTFEVEAREGVTVVQRHCIACRDFAVFGPFSVGNKVAFDYRNIWGSRYTPTSVHPSFVDIRDLYS